MSTIWRPALFLVVLAMTGCTGVEQPDGTEAAAGSVPGRTAAPTSPPPVEDPLTLLGRRAAHTATSFSDGEVFVAGGCITDGCTTATAETFVVASDGQNATSGPAMSDPRDSHTATLVDDTIVLVGGFGGEGEPPLSSIEVFEWRSGALNEAGMLSVGRGGHAATALGDGRVLIAGGWVAPRTYTATTELFDPLSGTIEPGPEMPVAADALDVVTLSDGRALVTGGQIRSGVATDVAAIFDPVTETWVETGRMVTARFKHMSVLLDDGTVLVIGGTIDDRTLLASTEIFDPNTGRFSVGPTLAEPRYKLPGGAVAIGEGRVVVAGGGRTVEVLDVTSGASRVIDRFAFRGSFSTINLLRSGDLLVIGGYDDQISLRRDARVIKWNEL